jgi:hypothetical protein
MSGGELFEALQIVGKPIKQLILVSYGAVASNGSDDVYHFFIV